MICPKTCWIPKFVAPSTEWHRLRVEHYADVYSAILISSVLLSGYANKQRCLCLFQPSAFLYIRKSFMIRQLAWAIFTYSHKAWWKFESWLMFSVLQFMEFLKFLRYLSPAKNIFKKCLSGEKGQLEFHYANWTKGSYRNFGYAVCK